MDQLWQLMDGATIGGRIFSPSSVLLSLLLAFVLGQVFAWVYYATHSGLSYSRSFVQSLILITVIVAMVMAVIGNSLITAVGLMGALAIVRFRNVLKDTRDLAYVFCALVVGMATGSQRYFIAILGTLVLCSIAIYLYLTSFGSHEPRNGFLRFYLPSGMGPDHPVLGILRRFCSDFQLVSVQDAGPGAGTEYAYQIMVRDRSLGESLLYEMERTKGIGSLSLTMQEDLLEV
jgi:hypothetical protein